MSDYIDRQTLLRDIEKYHLSDGKFQHWVEVQPPADAIDVVRCKDCKWYTICKNGCNGMCEQHIDAFNVFYPDDYCSFGERKVENND